MKANELRIGNRIQKIILKSNYTPDGDWGLVEEIEVSVGVLSMIESPTGLYEFNPIPLTEDWLVKFGFCLTTDSGLLRYAMFDQNGISFFQVMTIDFTSIKSNGCMYDLQYVHQLQNLFYVLTGHELELKN